MLLLCPPITLFCLWYPYKAGTQHIFAKWTNAQTVKKKKKKTKTKKKKKKNKNKNKKKDGWKNLIFNIYGVDMTIVHIYQIWDPLSRGRCEEKDRRLSWLCQIAVSSWTSHLTSLGLLPRNCKMRILRLSWLPRWACHRLFTLSYVTPIRKWWLYDIYLE